MIQLNQVRWQQMKYVYPSYSVHYERLAYTHTQDTWYNFSSMAFNLDFIDWWLEFSKYFEHKLSTFHKGSNIIFFPRFNCIYFMCACVHFFDFDMFQILNFCWFRFAFRLWIIYSSSMYFDLIHTNGIIFNQASNLIHMFRMQQLHKVKEKNNPHKIFDKM